MSREIIVIQDILKVGYNYKDKYYYINNKGYITKRTTPILIYDVLKVVEPLITTGTNEVVKVTLEDIKNLSTTYETLQELYFTYSDTGSYIATIQINDYKDNPITLNAEKNKLYIMNSNVIFDLSLNEEKRLRIEAIRLYYYDILGVDLSLQQVQSIYNMLVLYYLPIVYNTIEAQVTEEGTETLMYTNQFAVQDYSNKSPVTYTCTVNPNNLYITPPLYKDNIVYIEDNKITLTNSVPSSIHAGDIITVSNAETDVDGSVYSSDGTYTIQSIENNTIITTENFPFNFIYASPILYIHAYPQYITTIDRATREITFAEDIEGYTIGDVITVTGATTETEIETLSANGNYTIQSIGITSDGTTNNKVLIVEETPMYNFEDLEGTQAKAYKSIEAGNILAMAENTNLTLLKNPSVTLTTGLQCAIMYIDRTISTEIEITNIEEESDNSFSVTYTGSIAEEQAKYGTFEIPNPSTETVIEVTTTKYPLTMPIGTFLLDTKEECNNYIDLLRTENTGIKASIVEDILPILETETVSRDLFTLINTPVPSTKVLTWGKGAGESMNMTLIGLYSSVYGKEGEAEGL